MNIFHRLFCITVIPFLLTSCATRQTSNFCTILDFDEKIKSGVYVPKSDNVLFLLDASSSMFNSYKWKMKFSQAEDILGTMSLLIPNIPLKGGVRVFGPAEFPVMKGSSPFYGMTDYSRNSMMARMSTLHGPSGATPLAEALLRCADDLAGLTGTTALVILTDGEDVGQEAVLAAQSVKERLGSQVCFYPVLVGDDPAGKDILTQIAGIGGCGFAVTSDELTSTADVTSFVKAVFLERGVTRDSDKDGVYDPIDLCEATPPGTTVDADGCPAFDSPAKGDTAKVDLSINFSFDGHYILPQYYNSLQAFANFLLANPSLVVVLEGHTDKVGTPRYNQKLSLKRAEAVKNYLLTLQVPAAQLSIQGYGATQPVVDDDSPEGRQQNRRVMAVITNP